MSYVLTVRLFAQDTETLKLKCEVCNHFTYIDVPTLPKWTEVEIRHCWYCGHTRWWINIIRQKQEDKNGE